MRKVEVLVVEDEREKLDEVRGEVERFFGSDVTIDVAGTFAEATRAILSKSFDLIVTDLLLPRRAGEEAVDVSEEILDHLSQGEENRLTTVVAISRFADVVARRSGAFTRAGVFLIRYDEDWRECLSICMQKVAFRALYDFVVICALELERSAFAAVTMPGFEYGQLVNAQGMDARELRIGELSGVCVLQPRMGLVEAGIVSTRALSAFQPRLICMAGICGGLGKDAPLGTLLVSDVCWEHQAGKWTSEGFDIRSYQEPLDNEVRTVLNQMIVEDERLLALASQPHEVAVPLVGAKLRPTTSGSAVIASEGYAKEIRRQHGEVSGVDMEIYGMYRAAALHGRTPCFAAKTVVDRADEEKDDKLQRAGAILSARFVSSAIALILG